MRIKKGANRSFGLAISVSYLTCLSTPHTHTFPHTHTSTPPLVLMHTPCMHTITLLPSPSHLHTLILTQGSSVDTAVGVVVHKVSKGGVAEGKVEVGDRITSVNGTTTEGKSYQEVRDRGGERERGGRWGEREGRRGGGERETQYDVFGKVSLIMPPYILQVAADLLSPFSFTPGAVPSAEQWGGARTGDTASSQAHFHLSHSQFASWRRIHR